MTLKINMTWLIYSAHRGFQLVWCCRDLCKQTSTCGFVWVENFVSHLKEKHRLRKY